MRFYTRIASASLFNKSFTLIEPYIQHVTYWKEPKHTMQILKRTEKKQMSTSLNPHDEFLLAFLLALFLRLQLGLLNENVADCFDISPTKSSFIFTTWIKLLSKLLKKFSYLVALRSNLG